MLIFIIVIFGFLVLLTTVMNTKLPFQERLKEREQHYAGLLLRDFSSLSFSRSIVVVMWPTLVAAIAFVIFKLFPGYLPSVGWRVLLKVLYFIAQIKLLSLYSRSCSKAASMPATWDNPPL